MQDTYYRHSGRVPLRGLPIAITFVAIGVILSTSAYNLVSFFARFHLLDLLLLVPAGYLAGTILTAGLRLGKIRNNKTSVALALLTGLMMVYADQAVRLAVRQDALILDPAGLLNALAVIAKQADQLSSGPITGVNPMYAFWAAKAVGLFLTPLLGTLSLRNAPFCEHCNRWIGEAVELGPYRYIADPMRLKQAVETHQYETLRGLEATVIGSSMYSKVRITRCPDCDHTFLLSVDNISVSTDRDGKESKCRKRLIDQHIITPSVFKKLAA
ncbi:MAG: hypothetical protein QNK37_20040 [Acidobacteriota bacterium]|nr:hypothetical protein [Acidobacteriota bacterium]